MTDKKNEITIILYLILHFGFICIVGFKIGGPVGVCI